MNPLRRETYLAPADDAGPDGWRPTTEHIRITHNTNKLDTWGDHALWIGAAIATTLTASLTAWSAAELLAGPYGHTTGSNVWRLGFGLGLVADILWLIMLLLVRRARAALRTNPAANRAAWGFAAFSVALIAGHALVDGASIRTFQDFDLMTIFLLAVAAFPILTKILWSLLFNAFYLEPDPALAAKLDKEARILLADQIRMDAEHRAQKQRMFMQHDRDQLAKELGIALPHLDTKRGLPRVELTREDRDHRDTDRDTATPRQDTGHQDTATDTANTGHDTETGQDDATPHPLPVTPPRPPLPPNPHHGQGQGQGDDEPLSNPRPPLEPATAGRPSVAGVILGALTEGVDKDDTDSIRSRVEQVHGPIKENAGTGELKADTFRTSYRRAVKKFEKQKEEGTGFFP